MGCWGVDLDVVVGLVSTSRFAFGEGFGVN